MKVCCFCVLLQLLVDLLLLCMFINVARFRGKERNGKCMQKYCFTVIWISSKNDFENFFLKIQSKETSALFGCFLSCQLDDGGAELHGMYTFTIILKDKNIVVAAHSLEEKYKWMEVCRSFKLLSHVPAAGSFLYLSIRIISWKMILKNNLESIDYNNFAKHSAQQVSNLIQLDLLSCGVHYGTWQSTLNQTASYGIIRKDKLFFGSCISFHGLILSQRAFSKTRYSKMSKEVFEVLLFLFFMQDLNLAIRKAKEQVSSLWQVHHFAKLLF